MYDGILFIGMFATASIDKTVKVWDVANVHNYQQNQDVGGKTKKKVPYSYDYFLHASSRVEAHYLISDLETLMPESVSYMCEND